MAQILADLAIQAEVRAEAVAAQDRQIEKLDEVTHQIIDYSIK
jgi:hypothetical protein